VIRRVGIFFFRRSVFHVLVVGGIACGGAGPYFLIGWESVSITSEVCDGSAARVAFPLISAVVERGRPGLRSD